MNHFCQKKYLLLFFLYLNSFLSIGQIKPKSTIDLEKILIDEPNIQGLFYLLIANSKNNEATVTEGDDLEFSLIDGKLLSDTIYAYNDAIRLKSILEQKSNFEFQILFYLFDKEVDRVAVDSYLENLVRNEIFIPNTNITTKDSEGELIILGSKVPFKPFHKLKIKLLQDIKMILLMSILVLFLFSSVILVVFMIFIKSRKKERDHLTESFKDLIYEPLSNFLFEKTLAEIDGLSKKEIESFLPLNYPSKPLYKTVLIQEIISLNKNMKGEFKQKLKLIYRKLDLHLYSIQRLKHREWDVVTSAIVEVNEMDLKEALPAMEELVLHKNFYIRSSAVATQLNLSLDKSLKVLASQTYPLSAWQQMIYLRIIRYLSSQDMVKIIHLLESENKSVRIFGIKLVRYLGRIDRIAKLSEMFANASNEEKLEILKGFNALGAETELEHVHKSLFSNDQDICLQAIRTLKNIGNVKSEFLLQERARTTDSFLLKKEILRALAILDSEGFEAFVKSENNETYFRIQNHLNDPLLSDV